MSARRAIKILLGLLLLATTLVSIWHVPEPPRDLGTLLPPYAGFGLRERDLAARWEQVLANPLATSLLRTLGVDEAGVRALKDNEQVARWVRDLVGSDAALAYLPEHPGGRPAAWMLVSRLGAAHLKWRWLLETARLPGARRFATHHGHSIWRLPLEGSDGGEHLYCTLMEGVLLATLSADEQAQRLLIDRYDMQVYLSPQANPLDGFPSDAPTRGWVRWGFVEPLRFELSRLDEAGLAARLVAEGRGVPVLESWRDDGAGPRFLARLPEAPIAVLSLHPRLYGALRAQGLDGDLAPTLDLLLAPFAAAREMHLLAFDDPYQSRYRGLKTPFLLVAIRLAPESGDGSAHIGRLLDRLNAVHRQGLIASDPGRAELAGLSLVESTEDNYYARLPARERIAYTQIGEWLLVGTHAESLAMLLEGRCPPAQGPLPAWLEPMRRPGVGAAWMDLDRGGARLSAMFTLQALALGFREPGSSAEWMKRAGEVRTWAQALAPLGVASFVLSFEHDRAVMHGEAGESGP